MERVEVRDDRHEPPEPRGPGWGLPRLDELEDRRAEAAEALAEAPRVADAPQRHPRGLERRGGPIEVGGGDDDVVECDRAVGVA